LVLGAAFFGCGGGSSGGTGGGSGGSGGAGGGMGGSSSITDLVPVNNTIAGWTVDSSNSKTAGQVAALATNVTDTTNLIDGAAADFFAAPYSPVTFAWQNYLNASLESPIPPSAGGPGATLKLYILQMPSADQACGLYTSLLSDNFYASTWTDPTSPTVGTKSRITDSGTDWWVNFCKGVHYVEARLSPSYGPAPDYTPGDATTKKAAMDFAVAVAAKM
jgi:hypothetical protein